MYTPYQIPIVVYYQHTTYPPNNHYFSRNILSFLLSTIPQSQTYTSYTERSENDKMGSIM